MDGNQTRWKETKNVLGAAFRLKKGGQRPIPIQTPASAYPPQQQPTRQGQGFDYQQPLQTPAYGAYTPVPPLVHQQSPAQFGYNYTVSPPPSRGQSYYDPQAYPSFPTPQSPPTMEPQQARASTMPSSSSAPYFPQPSYEPPGSSTPFPERGNTYSGFPSTPSGFPTPFWQDSSPPSQYPPSQHRYQLPPGAAPSIPGFPEPR